MARIRSIHPALFTDEAFVELGSDAQILLLGLWTEADDQGVFEWKPITLRMRLRPTKDGPIEPLLSELEAGNCIRRYETGGRQYGAIRNFRKFQKPKSPNAVHPTTPEIRKYTALTQSISETPPVKTEAFPQNGEIASLMEGRGEDDGEEGEGSARDWFAEFWSAYPKKDGEVVAKLAFSQACTLEEPEIIIAGAKRCAATVRRDKTEPRFIKAPGRWLEERRWTDGQGPPQPPSAFNSPEELAAQRAMMEKHYGKA